MISTHKRIRAGFSKVHGIGVACDSEISSPRPTTGVAVTTETEVRKNELEDTSA